ncbi:MAG: hypothetical protein ACRDNE_00565 [Gaiellaceae bacterium]
MSTITLICTTPKPGPFRKGRVCTKPGCNTILHTRHEGKHCYVHAKPKLVTTKTAMADLAYLMVRR